MKRLSTGLSFGLSESMMYEPMRWRPDAGLVDPREADDGHGDVITDPQSLGHAEPTAVS